MKKFINTDILYVLANNHFHIDHVVNIAPSERHASFYEFRVPDTTHSSDVWYIEEQVLQQESCFSGGAIFATSLEALKVFLSVLDGDITSYLDLIYEYEQEN